MLYLLQTSMSRCIILCGDYTQLCLSLLNLTIRLNITLDKSTYAFEQYVWDREGIGSHMSGVLLPLWWILRLWDIGWADDELGREEEVDGLNPHVPLSEMLLVMGLYVLLLGAGCAWRLLGGLCFSVKTAHSKNNNPFANTFKLEWIFILLICHQLDFKLHILMQHWEFCCGQKYHFLFIISYKMC